MKKCKYCNEEFSGGPANKVFCSSECNNKFKNEKIHDRTHDNKENRKCVECGSVFVVNVTNVKKKFCSNKCCTKYQEDHRRQPGNTCDVCGTSFNGRFRTCSPECALILSNKNRFFEREKVCVECGETFTARHGRASLCSNRCNKRKALKKWRSEQPERECEWCGKMYFPKNHRDKSCSKKCAYKNRLRSRIREYACDICGGVFKSNFHGGLTNRHVCDKKTCQETALVESGIPYKQGYRGTCKKIWGEKSCILCGDSGNVHAHHISGDTSLQSDVVWLCKKHHNAVHYEFITKNPKTPQDYQDGLITMWYLLFKGELD